MSTRGASELSQAVAAALRRHQATHMWKIAAVARETGHNYRTLYRMITGVSEMGVADLLLVCQVIGVSPAEIIADSNYLADLAKQTASRRAVPDNVPEPANDQSPADATVTHIGVNWDAYQGAKAADNDVEADHEPQ